MTMQKIATKRKWLTRTVPAVAIPAVMIAMIAMVVLGDAAPTAEPATVSRTAAVQAVTSGDSVYLVKGFRSALFGMDDATLRPIIAKDLGVSKNAIRIENNDVQRTRALVVEMPTLDPGPGSALVSYVLGYKSRKLIQVNIVWGLDDKIQQNDAALQDIYNAANILSYHLADYTWRDGGVVKNALVDPTTLMMFHGEDAAQGAAEIILGNVSITLNEEGSPSSEASEPSKPVGRAYLRVSYMVNRIKPDIYTLTKGQF